VRVLVDTPVWSEFFRRAAPQSRVTDAFRVLVEEGEAVLIGPIRQEILSGVKDGKQFDRLRLALRAFPDEQISTEDHEQAAILFNRCRAQGIQGSNTDFLICAVSQRLEAPVFTLDRDFDLFAKALPIKLHQPV
jgi:predicted nucleic acid-binding protein